MEPITLLASAFVGLSVVSHTLHQAVSSLPFVSLPSGDYVRVKPGAQPSRAQTYAQAGGFTKYLEQLDQAFDSRKASLDAEWSKDQVRAAVVQAAAAVNLPAAARAALWGIIVHESGGRPVGIFAGDPAKAAAANSTAYGIGQVTLTTFLAAVAKHVDWNHKDIWHPALGAISAAWVLKAKLASSGGNLRAALASYAGSAAGGERLYAYAQKYGSEVA